MGSESKKGELSFEKPMIQIIHIFTDRYGHTGTG